MVDEIDKEIFEVREKMREGEKKALDRSKIEDHLRKVSEIMELKESPEVNICVCGGAALNILGLRERTTEDVDVMGEVEDESFIVSPELPDEFHKAVKEVAEEEGLETDWVNTGASFVGGMAPEGVIERATKRSYGEKLHAWFISRYDQIHFKLYAAIDIGGYHINDLKALDPEFNELQEASDWILQHHEQEKVREDLRDLLGRMGFDNVIE